MKKQSVDGLAVMIERMRSERGMPNNINVTQMDNIVVIEERIDGRPLWTLHVGDGYLGFVGTRTELALEIIAAIGDI